MRSQLLQVVPTVLLVLLVEVVLGVPAGQHTVELQRVAEKWGNGVPVSWDSFF